MYLILKLCFRPVDKNAQSEMEAQDKIEPSNVDQEPKIKKILKKINELFYK